MTSFINLIILISKLKGVCLPCDCVPFQVVNSLVNEFPPCKVTRQAWVDLMINYSVDQIISYNYFSLGEYLTMLSRVVAGMTN